MVFIPPKKKNPETIIQNQVRQLLRMDGWYVIRHQQGLGCHKGLSDLSAIKNGITIYIEIKTPNNIHIAICEKILPRLSVYISSNLLIIPNINPLTNIPIGFNITFFIINPISIN